MEISKEVTISIEEYKELLEYKNKCVQYRNYFYENNRNSMITNGLVAIEGKPIWVIEKEVRGD